MVKKNPPRANRARAKVPLKRVVLFSSGVGYFEHDGKVTDNAKVDLKFKVKDINDLLKSMVVQDFDGGHISTVGYGSNDPLDKRLSSFAINLNGNPTLAQLLEQIRGETVEIDAPNKIVGTIVSIETRKTEIGKDHFIDQTVMNVATDGGLRSVILESAGSIRLLNPKLDAELHKALAVLATAHEIDKKTVSLDFRGEGKRNVRVGYIEETPIWKTSYRLVLSDEKKPFLQGWAIVENPSEEDWNDVRLSLVSGRPISFTMDLYQPTYIPRPQAHLELFSSLGPQTYEQDLAKRDMEFRRVAEGGAAMDRRRAAMPAAAHGRDGHAQGGGGASVDAQASQCRPAVEPRPGRGVGGHRRQRGRAVPVRHPHPGHALAARIGHAAHPQQRREGREVLDLQPRRAAQAPLERPEAHQLDRPAPDAGADHGLRRRHLCRRRHDPGHPAGQRAADQLRPGPRHGGGPREQGPPGADHQRPHRQGHADHRPQVHALAGVHGEELRQEGQEGPDRVRPRSELDARFAQGAGRKDPRQVSLRGRCQAGRAGQAGGR